MSDGLERKLLAKRRCDASNVTGIRRDDGIPPTKSPFHYRKVRDVVVMRTTCETPHRPCLLLAHRLHLAER